MQVDVGHIKVRTFLLTHMCSTPSQCHVHNDMVYLFISYSTTVHVDVFRLHRQKGGHEGQVVAEQIQTITGRGRAVAVRFYSLRDSMGVCIINCYHINALDGGLKRDTTSA